MQHMFNKYHQKLAFLCVLFGGFLSFYRLWELMPFIGDQGWFYLSARDLLLTGKIPLVGIASSHPWLHQGALWTYMLAISLWLFAYSPFAGAYLSIAFGLVTVLGIYKIGSKMFSENVGLIAAFLYATSPLAILHARMPYHTSPIPFFALLWFWLVYQWVKKNNVSFFPWIIVVLVILYNFEIATVLFTGMTILIWLYGYYTKKKWAINIFNKKMLLFALSAWLFVMVPMLLYDVSHGFPQTLRFVAWIGYKLLQAVGLFHGVPADHTFGEVVMFFGVMLQRLLFLQNQVIALAIFFVSFSWLLVHLFLQWRKKQVVVADVFLGFVLVTLCVSLIFNKTPSEAYLPMLFPFIFLMVACFFARLMNTPIAVLLGVFVLILIGFSNSYMLINNNYLTGYSGYGPTFAKRMSVAKKIVQKSKGKPYMLSAKGEGSQFASFTMNYEYLTWWLGNAPVQQAKRTFVVEEKSKGITVFESIVRE